MKLILFKCDWFEVLPQGRHQSRGYKKDAYGFINVDTTCFHYKDDPFVLGIQAEQVCYAKDVENPNWCSVIKLRPRNLFAMPNREQEVDDENDNSNYEPYELNEVLRSQHDMGGSEECSEDMTSQCRSDLEGLGIEVSGDENIHLEDDLLSDNNETDIEEDNDGNNKSVVLTCFFLLFYIFSNVCNMTPLCYVYYYYYLIVCI